MWTPEEFKILYLGEFKPDERQIQLHERLKQYYREVDGCGCPKTDREAYRAFRGWCYDRGYTQEEVNSAKKCI